MRSRRLACVFIGLWLGASLWMAWLTADSFHSVDRVLQDPSPEAAPQLKSLKPDLARMLLRYEASERNRSAFETWESVQICLGIGFFFYLLLCTQEGKLPIVLALLMLAIVVVQHWLFTPTLVALGRLIDFVPAGAPASRRQEFWVVHTAYSGAEVVKWLVGLGIALKLALGRGRGRSGNAREDVDAVDKRNYRHIDR